LPALIKAVERNLDGLFLFVAGFVNAYLSHFEMTSTASGIARMARATVKHMSHLVSLSNVKLS
jgi:hypothetical protein